MRADLLKSYLKYRYKGIIIGLFILILLNWPNHGGDLYFNLFIFLILVGREYYHFGDKIEKIKKLKAKGLTEEDLINIEFVKLWEETRKDGLWKYSIRDGAIIAGAGLTLVLDLLFAMIFSARFKNILSEPSGMFAFIAYSYISGAIIGVILFRILWHYKERRFIRLTDPFNVLFASKKASFNDPV